MRPSPPVAAEVSSSLPKAWGTPLLGVPFPCARTATRRMGVNWNGDESIDRLATEIGPRHVLGCAIFEGFKPGGREKIIRVDVWVAK